MTATRVQGILLERLAEEILAVEVATAEAHALNQSAAAVFDLCNGKASKAEMAAEIQRRTGLPADEEIVDLALAELVDAGLVTLDTPEPPTVSRRTLIRRLALSVGTAMMLPVVETILLPTPAAASPVTNPLYAPLPLGPAPVPQAPAPLAPVTNPLYAPAPLTIFP